MSQRQNGLIETFEDFPKTIYLTERATGLQVPAVFDHLTRQIAREGIDNIWWNETDAPKEKKRAEPDFNWKWVTLLGRLQSSKGAAYVRGWAIRTVGDNKVQGAILYRTNAISFYKTSDGRTQPAIYGEFLATAPWNRQRVIAPRPGRFKGVGTGLLRLAVIHSHFLGGDGRINLTSVDGPETIRVYREFGFLPVAEVPEGRLVFELSKEAAARHIEQAGLQ